MNARWRPAALVAALAAALATGGLTQVSQAVARPPGRGPHYQATIVRTGYGIPHITARTFGSLGFGYGFAFASDDLCTMADDYVTVEGQRSRYFGPDGTYTSLLAPAKNLASDLYWRSVIGGRVIQRLLSVRTGPGAIGPQVRQLISGYAAGYNRYLASVGGSQGVPDPTCRGQAWVKPITTLDAYLRVYQLIETEGQAADPAAIAGAAPPGPAAAATTTAATTTAAITTGAAGGLPSAGQVRELGRRLSAQARSADVGSNAIAVGSAGNRDRRHGLLLGNPHYPWAGPYRFYEVQLTIPGTLNVEGATLFGEPLVVIGFTATMAWSHTVSHALTTSLYQLTLVPGHPTEYVYHGRPTAMTSQAVTVAARSPAGKLTRVRRTLWSTRYGPVVGEIDGMPLPWTAKTAYALDDANAGNFRFLNHFLATDQARSAAGELAILRRYQGVPWANTLVADATGHALYADIQPVPDISDAELARCQTALGREVYAQGGPPILDGSRPACGWGTDRDSAAPGIFGPAEEPSLMRRDFVENSNDSAWLTNPARPLTGYPSVIGDAGSGIIGTAGADLGLRTRSALAMVTGRIGGSDGLGPPGFTLARMKDLMFSDIQYGATLVKPQLVAMCRAFTGGLAPTSSGGHIAVGDACRVLAAWNGREDIGSRGAAAFRAFWENALNLPGGPWTHPFDAARPLSTPYGLDAASPRVQQAFGDALASLKAAHLPADVALGQVQYVAADGAKIPLPGGPGDPDGEFNGIYTTGPGSVPLYGSSYIQVVTWASGDRGPAAATLLTYGESDNPGSPHFADQTRLFSRGRWVTAYLTPAQVAAHAVSATVVRGG